MKRQKRGQNSIFGTIISMIGLYLIVCVVIGAVVLWFQRKLVAGNLYLEMQSCADQLSEVMDGEYLETDTLPDPQERLHAAEALVMTQYAGEETGGKEGYALYRVETFYDSQGNADEEITLETYTTPGVWIKLTNWEDNQPAGCNLSDWLSEEEIDQLREFLSYQVDEYRDGEVIHYEADVSGYWMEDGRVGLKSLRVQEKICQYAYDDGKSCVVRDGAIVWEKNLDAPEGASLEELTGTLYSQWDLNTLKQDYPQLRTVLEGSQSPSEAWDAMNHWYDCQGLITMRYRTGYYIIREDGNVKGQLLLQGEVPLLKVSLPTLGILWGVCLALFFLVSVMMIVHSRRYERRRAELEERRRQQSRAIAHDLKTPLAVISGYAETMSENLLPEKNAHYAAEIQREAQRMNEGIQRLLQLDQAESGILHLTQFPLEQLCAQVVERYRQPLAEKNITVNLSGSGTITADREKLAQVLDNLMSNALRHTPENGKIELRITPKRVDLFNQGEAIPEEAIPHIWEPYYQVQPQRNSGGNGLGLSIARTILEQHGFSYGVRNQEDGVTFWFEVK